jgi:hypothetical protein
LQGLGEEIGEHLFCWAMLHADGFKANTVLDKEISNVDVPRVGATGFASVLLELDGTLVILVKNVFLENVPLAC